MYFDIIFQMFYVCRYACQVFKLFLYYVKYILEFCHNL